MRLIALFILPTLLITPAAHAAQTIVGKWAFSKKECKTKNVVQIKPMSLTDNNNVFCYFVSVRRSGNAVNWKGSCYVDSGRRPEIGNDGDVEARLSGGKLRIDGLGFGLGPLVRCR